MTKLMNYLKSLNTSRNRSLLFYIIYAGILLGLLLFGASVNIHASNITAKQPTNITQQYHAQNKPKAVKNMRLGAAHHSHNWFRDGLNNHELRDRDWITRHESGNRWRVVSYGHRCIGYFQLDPRYLGYKHGHVNLNHKHQVRVADKYAKKRYGNWINVKHFWQSHHWY